MDGSQGSSGPAAFDLTAGYEWDNEGRMTAMTYPEVGTAGKRYTYGFDAMGRTNAMVDTSDSNTVASATFGVAGEIASLGYFGRSESRTYNNLLQMTRQTVTYSGSTWMDNQYVYTSGANNGRIAQMIDGVTGETIDYTYDVWNRLTKAETEGTTGVQWGQSFTYDGFGNLYAKSQTKGSAPSFNVNINPATNGGPASYSHEIPDGSMDVEWRPLGSSTVRYFYDQAGKRVMTRTDAYGWPNYPYSATYEVAMYGLGGQRLVTANCSYDGQARPSCGVGGANNMYFGGKLVMSRGVVVATDRLGSVRRNGNGESFAYYPYGEERTSTSEGREKFGTYVRDSATQDYADQRYYGVGTGRFGTPDPSGTEAVDMVNSVSWNTYAYANADPINLYDPEGLAASSCTSSLFSYNGTVLGTVGDVLKASADLTILAETEYTEAGHGANTNSTAEEDIIGEVIMNRWALVNGYWYLYPLRGRQPIDVSAWGSPGGGIASVTQNGQFAVWDGDKLTESAQRNLDAALNSSFDSKLCSDLAWAIGSAISFLTSPTINLYYDTKTNLVPLAFNSAKLPVPGYMQEIGSFGDSNVFYGASLGKFSGNLLPIPRRTPPRRGSPPRGGPREPE